MYIWISILSFKNTVYLHSVLCILQTCTCIYMYLSHVNILEYYTKSDGVKSFVVLLLKYISALFTSIFTNTT